MDKTNHRISVEGSDKIKVEYFSSEINLKSINGPEGILMKGSSLAVDLMIENRSDDDQTIWGDLGLQDPLSDWLDIAEKMILIPRKQTLRLTLAGGIPIDILSGDYIAEVDLWNKEPGFEAKKLLFTQLPGLRIYSDQEFFKTWPKSNWLASDSKLGRSKIQSNNVCLKDGRLNLKLPAMTLNGAEIKTAKKVHYGSYEIRMKVPDQPSSLTGFFLYDQPDYEQEIDIELMNQPEGIILFTTYAKGRQTQSTRLILPFDPTLDFHRYRIDYLPGRVNFFVDDKLMQTWTEGLPSTPMYLMLNSWYPNWLEGASSSEDNFLVIDWILK